MEIPGTGSSDRFCYWAIVSRTLSVVAEMVCLETSTPYISARSAEISPVAAPWPPAKSPLIHARQSPLPLARGLLLEAAALIL
ncbi:hypothetical protein GCM10010412_098480 [Nonomuraea recticatena]|uniref:Uncharacterized protein n=1 Tax=Nonomuraea recticatena TaxID=46178 RepID=A0ABP6FUG6_9ACTN